MKENVSAFHFIKEAFQCEFDQRNRGRYENDRYPMSAFEKFRYVVSTLLSKGDMQELIRVYSSYNYGVHLLNSVFPKLENPEEFHSRDGYVRLDEHPTQVMGWKEHDEIIDEGVKQGFDRDYINLGFELQAEKRGIDLEWSFFENVLQIKDTTKSSLPNSLNT
jgi:hypothetical protein